MSFVNISEVLLILYFGRKLIFLIFSTLLIRFGKIRCGRLFGLLTLLNKGRQGYGGIITMYMLYLTNSEPTVEYSQKRRLSADSVGQSFWILVHGVRTGCWSAHLGWWFSMQKSRTTFNLFQCDPFSAPWIRKSTRKRVNTICHKKYFTKMNKNKHNYCNYQEKSKRFLQVN